MKGYTVTEDQLENLGELQLSTALLFSVGTGLLSFWIGVQQDMVFAGRLPTALKAGGSAYRGEHSLQRL